MKTFFFWGGGFWGGVWGGGFVESIVVCQVRPCCFVKVWNKSDHK